MRKRVQLLVFRFKNVCIKTQKKILETGHISSYHLYCLFRFVNCFSLLHLPWFGFPPAQLYFLFSHYISHTFIENPHLHLPPRLSPYFISSLSASSHSLCSSVFVMLTRGHWNILSRSSPSEVWRPHAWMAEWNRQLCPSWGPSDF